MWSPARWLLLLLVVLALCVCAGTGRLVFASRATPPSPAQHQARETVHYWGHLAAGRALQLCPCTRRRAYWEYWQAHFHAHTPQQRALISTQVPHSPAAGIADVAVIGWLGTRALLANPLARQTMAVVLAVCCALLLGRVSLSHAVRRARPG